MNQASFHKEGVVHTKQHLPNHFKSKETFLNRDPSSSYHFPVEDGLEVFGVCRVWLRCSGAREVLAHADRLRQLRVQRHCIEATQIDHPPGRGLRIAYRGAERGLQAAPRQRAKQTR